MGRSGEFTDKAGVMKAEDLDALELLAKAATPGPWAWAEGPTLDMMLVRVGYELGDDYILCPDKVSQADGNFIMAANPAAVLALIAEVRRLWHEMEVK
jgi:hypothetical protein